MTKEDQFLNLKKERNDYGGIAETLGNFDSQLSHQVNFDPTQTANFGFWQDFFSVR